LGLSDDEVFDEKSAVGAARAQLVSLLARNRLYQDTQFSGDWGPYHRHMSYWDQSDYERLLSARLDAQALSVIAPYPAELKDKFWPWLLTVLSNGTYDEVIELTLTQAFLVCENVAELAEPFLSRTRQLKAVDLSDNCLYTEGLKELLKKTRQNPGLESVNLRCNSIFMPGQRAVEAAWHHSDRKQTDAKFSVDINLNYFTPEASRHLERTFFRSVRAPNVQRNSIFCADKQVSYSHHFIYLFRKKAGGNHARIVIEGVGESGQSFLYTADFVPQKLNPQGQVRTKYWAPESLHDASAYAFICFDVTRTQTALLQRIIENDKEKNLYYNKFGPKKGMSYNCYTWALAKLVEAKIATEIIGNWSLMAPSPSWQITGQQVIERNYQMPPDPSESKSGCVLQ
jgi:hypothetical protein